MIDAALAEREKLADMLARAIWTAEASWKAQREFAWARHIADVILANPKLLAVCANEALEKAAAALELRASRSSRARGGLGQIFADTQDAEARDCAELVRALKAEG